jgi:hypothetical protein
MQLEHSEFQLHVGMLTAYNMWGGQKVISCLYVAPTVPYIEPKRILYVLIAPPVLTPVGKTGKHPASFKKYG